VSNGADHCVAVGTDALVACTNGDYSVAIGSSAGNSLTGGNKCTLIGYNTDASASDSTNQTVIGYDAQGVADNSVTLGDGNVTAVYMADDSGASVNCGQVISANSGIDTTAGYTGISNLHTKTAGASNASDLFYGLKSWITHNDTAGFFDEFIGADIRATSTQTKSAPCESTNIRGMYLSASMAGNTDVSNLYGQYILADVNAGQVDSSVFGQFISVDIESGVAQIVGNVYGIYLTMDDSQTADGTTFGIKTDLGTHIDWAYQTYDLVADTIAVQISRAGAIDAEGAIQASQALDYAEYFESKDGSSIAIGTSVKLDGDKIVVCSEGDTPLGVIRPSGSSAVIGGGQLFHWQEKYMKDDYGADVMEDYTLTKWIIEVDHAEYIKRGRTEQEELQYSKVEGSKEVLYKEGDELPEGKEVGDVKEAAVADTYFREHKYHSDRIPDSLTAPDDAEVIEIAKQRQKLNPDYDPSKEYKSREERNEWHIVGLLGQIPITKGQPTGNWIKMKDVSDTVEMYFVK